MQSERIILNPLGEYIVAMCPDGQPLTIDLSQYHLRSLFLSRHVVGQFRSERHTTRAIHYKLNAVQGPDSKSYMIFAYPGLIVVNNEILLARVRSEAATTINCTKIIWYNQDLAAEIPDLLMRAVKLIRKSQSPIYGWFPVSRERMKGLLVGKTNLKINSLQELELLKKQIHDKALTSITTDFI